MTGEYDRRNARRTDPWTSVEGTTSISYVLLGMLQEHVLTNDRPKGWTNGELADDPRLPLTYEQVHQRMGDLDKKFGIAEPVRTPDGQIVTRYWQKTGKPHQARRIITNRPLGSAEVLEGMTPEEKIKQVYADYEQLSLLDPLRGGRGKKNRCPLIRGEGPLDAPVMLIGEAPGEEEVKQGRPFVGPSGQLLIRLLAEAGVPHPRQLCYITNVILYRPPDNRTPLIFEINISKRRLLTEIWAVGPQLIITLGATALRAVHPRDTARITDIHGRLERVTLTWPREDPAQPMHQHSCNLLPTFHPSAALRDRIVMGKMQADLSALTRMMEAARDRGDPG
jgi:uracil-DNA glycosylase